MNISIDSPKENFREHISLSSNSRIFFSGKFGTGKSHFLKEFFKSEEEKALYNVFWISPVNYVVGANQDIFEWIKIDVAKQLLSNYVIGSKKDKEYSENFLIQNYLYQNINSIFNKLLLSISNELVKKKTGISFLDLFEKKIAGYRKFKLAAKEYDKADSTKVIDYLTSSTLLPGSIFEEDITTNIIRANIELLGFNSGKESILIIDDLDRLDPEHIFRILNILSCHNNHFDANKFGFAKVILVCDIHNIEIIYKHKYGKADFEGYIEKFFTYQPFHYSLKNAVIDYCYNQLEVKNIHVSGIKTMCLILKILVEQNLFKIRNLKKISTYHLSANTRFKKKVYKIPINIKSNPNTFFKTDEIEVDFNDFGFLHVANLLIVAFGGTNGLMAVLEQIVHKGDRIDETMHQHLLESLCILSALAKKNVNNDTNVFYDNSSNSYTNYGHHLRHPSIQCLNISLSLSLKWTTNDKYVKGNYFDGVIISRTSNGNGINIDMLVDELKAILEFAIKEGIFTNVRD